MHAVLLPLSIMLAAALPAQPPVVAGFCKALSADSVDAFVALAADPEKLRQREFQAVRELITHYDRVAVDRCEATVIDGSTVSIDVVGTGISRNAARQRIPIPRHWELTLTSDSRIRSALDDETRDLERLLTAGSDEQRARILADSDLPVVAVARALVRQDTLPARDAALFLLARDHDPVAQSYALCALGEVSRRANEPAQASKLFEAARTLAANSGSCDAEATATHLAAATAADDATQITLLQKTVAMADTLNDPEPAFLALSDLCTAAGTDLGAMSRTGEALESFAKRYGSIDAELIAATVRAAMALTVNDAPRAIEAYRRVTSIAHQTGDALWEARAWANLGLNYRQAGDLRESSDAFRRAIALVEHDDGKPTIRSYAHSWLGINLVESGRIAEAESHLDAALALPPDAVRWRHFFPLLLLEELRHAQGRTAEAIAAQREAIAISPTSLSMIYVFEEHLGDSLTETGDLPGAIDAYRASIDLVEARRAGSTSNALVKARHFATRAPVYRKLESILFRLGRFDEALAIAERIKARSLTDSLGGADNLPLTADEHRKYEELNRDLLLANGAVMRASGTTETDARKQQTAARANLERFEEDAAFRYANATASSASIDPAAAIAGYRGSPVIEYSIANGMVVAYVVRDGRVTGKEVASAKDVEATTTRLTHSLEGQELRYGNAAARLYSQILAPLVPLLPENGPLVIIPDGFLWRVPFSALPSPDGRFLMEKYAISYAPSMTELRRAAQRQHPSAASEEVLAIGNPRIASATSKKAAAYRGLSLGALPDAAIEARTIGELYGSSRSTVLTGAAATETALKKLAGNARILHLATHGMIESDSPLYSALVLSRLPSDANDGLLEMREIAGLHLDADLAVLSACDTANGTIYPGEGVMGLSWAFLSAGCATTVVSQWKAESHSTSLLMIELHRQLLQGFTVSESLRRAQLALMKNPRYRHPFYWAAFIVVGKDAPLTLP